MGAESPKTRYFNQSHFRMAVIGAIVLTLLVVGQTFLIPLAIAILLWNLLDAFVTGVMRVHIGSHPVPRWLATALGVGAIVFSYVVFVRILASQADAIAEAVPRYVDRLETIFSQAVAFMGADTRAMAKEALDKLDITSVLSGAVGSAGSLLASMGLVALYVGFLLAEQHNLPKKIAALFKDKSEEREVRELFSKISAGIRRYIWIKTVMSLLTGGASYVVLRVMGVDFAETWALVIFLLNYIPSIGSALGVIFPALLALVQFDTLAPFLIIVAGLGSIQFAIGNILEPMFTGRSLNLSSFVIILSLTFWGAIWGIPGMFLSVPITVVAMIVCSHVPSWRWVAVILSTDGRITAMGADAT